jgi:hypothetical protein
MEIIHVELPNKGGEVFVAEVGRQDLLLKTLDVKDGEMGAIFVPADDVRVGLVLNDLMNT